MYVHSYVYPYIGVDLAASLECRQVSQSLQFVHPDARPGFEPGRVLNGSWNHHVAPEMLLAGKREMCLVRRHHSAAPGPSGRSAAALRWVGGWCWFRGGLLAGRVLTQRCVCVRA